MRKTRVGRIGAGAAAFALALWAPAEATVFEYETFDAGWTMAGAGWGVDRYLPSTVGSSSFDGGDRLHFGISGAARSPGGSFYYYEGIKHDVTMPELAHQSFSIDLYLGSDWGSTDRSVGLWAVGRDGLGDISAYPIIHYRNGSATTAGFYSFDYFNGVWDLLTTTSAGDYGGWHNLRFDLSQGSGMQYYIDDTAHGSLFADPATVDLQAVILNAYNFGGSYDQDIYWDNFQARAAVPEPGTLMVLSLAMAGAGAIRRKRRLG